MFDFTYVDLVFWPAQFISYHKQGKIAYYPWQLVRSIVYCTLASTYPVSFDWFSNNWSLHPSQPGSQILNYVESLLASMNA